MNYDVLEESRHAVDNLVENAWANHKEEYINTLTDVEDINERIDNQELKIKEANDDMQAISEAQDELTKIIDDIIEFNDGFNSSIIEVDDDNPIVDPDNQFQLDTSAIDTFLNNIA